MQSRKSHEHLPKYYQTSTNKKILSATLDQLVQPGRAIKVNGFVGRKHTAEYSPNDYYMPDISKERSDYKLEPAYVSIDSSNTVLDYYDYNDYINFLKNNRADVSDHNRINQQEYHAWDPHVDWDKLVNFREYYWLENGPVPVHIDSDTLSVQTTDQISSNNGFEFGSYSNSNPTLTVYRGVTYHFQISTPGHQLSIRSTRELYKPWTELTQYAMNDIVVHNGVSYKCIIDHFSNTSFDYERWELHDDLAGIINNNTDNGVIQFTPDTTTPDHIFYMCDQDLHYGGMIVVKNATSRVLNVETDIIGKVSCDYSIVSLSNGMIVHFGDNVLPEQFRNNEYHVTGVGTSIQLIPRSLDLDQISPDYITISKRAQDGNLWSRTNQWVHRDSIIASYHANNQIEQIDENFRARVPIIEFDPNIRLFNHGTKFKFQVDLIDDFTQDIFKSIETQQGYIIDQVPLQDGMTVLFTQETDQLRNNKIYQIKFINVGNSEQISLIEIPDAKCEQNHVVYCTSGSQYGGKNVWLSETGWKVSQHKQTANQEPLFDICDQHGISLSDTTVYDYSNFAGTTLFQYSKDGEYLHPELGFPVKYQTIENTGDIVFESTYNTQTFSYKENNDIIDRTINIGYIKRYSSINDYQLNTDFGNNHSDSIQPIVQETVTSDPVNNIPINVLVEPVILQKDKVTVFQNGRILGGEQFVINYDDSTPIVTLSKTSASNDFFTIKIKPDYQKTHNGYYELPVNLSNNPLNSELSTISYSEIANHVQSIVQSISKFSGRFPGSNNLRDLGPVSLYGTQIVKHTSPVHVAMHLLMNSEANIIQSLDHASDEYRKFKNEFMNIADSLELDGTVVSQVSHILRTINHNKSRKNRYYYTDMVPYLGHQVTQYNITHSNQLYFPLSNVDFSASNLSSQAVLVYLNDIQLIRGKDYQFNESGFVELVCDKSIGDELLIYEYENTNGCHVPATPTKLGLYPAYEPQIITDSSYLEPTQVLIGHDGSKTICEGDYRDQLLLELEKRIYNNIKIDYDDLIFNIHDYIPGIFRRTGISESAFYNTILSDFRSWLSKQGVDYAENHIFNKDNPFTYNYKNSKIFNDQTVTGTWKKLYQSAYDTTTPHISPWNMIGYHTQPDWWEHQYGKAPYTRDNYNMWADLERGIIREPGNIHVDVRYKRDGLLGCIPVSSTGELLDPIQANLVKQYNLSDMDSQFEYLSGSPAEIAWKDSSDFRFSQIKSMLLNFPSSSISHGLDTARQQVSASGTVLYNESYLTLESLVLPSGVSESTSVHTSGLINYIRDYYSYDLDVQYQSFKQNLEFVGVKLGVKLAGFTSSDKIRMEFSGNKASESQTVPIENYQLFLNKSIATDIIDYSGIIIEKTSSGYLITGYSQRTPCFYYYTALRSGNDPSVIMGGVSESFTEWEPDRTYNPGMIIKHRNEYYRVLKFHTTSASYNEEYYARLPELPVKGGSRALLRSQFTKSLKCLPYGTVLATTQEVVDFIAGHSYYLKTNGVGFEKFDSSRSTVQDWTLSIKEFLLWTSVSNRSNTAIVISPGAEELSITTQFSTIDDLGHNALDVSGTHIPHQFINVSRESPNKVTVSCTYPSSGLHHVAFNLVNYEHVMVFDEFTKFGDMIYSSVTGYRRPRLRMVGYIAPNWRGVLDIPGFLYDQAIVRDWQPWVNYHVGEVVKYKQLYYIALHSINGSEKFEYDSWAESNHSPEQDLFPNVEYRIQQFNDFYSLDTNNFDAEQQKFAQHLIGYQPREYLSNIAPDLVSQYKLYQGFIRDKGTHASITKMFNTAPDAKAIDVYEEWALLSGRYGSVNNLKSVEIPLKESDTNPHIIQLSDNSVSAYPVHDYHYNEIYFSEESESLPIYTGRPQVPVIGYVNQDHVVAVLNDLSDITNTDLSECPLGHSVWVTTQPWAVYEHVKTDIQITITAHDTDYIHAYSPHAEFFRNISVIGVHNTQLDGFYQIHSINDGTIVLINRDKSVSGDQTGFVSIFENRRYNTVNRADQYIEDTHISTRVWIDDIRGSWKVLEKTASFDYKQIITNKKANTDFSNVRACMSVDYSDSCLVIGRPDDGAGRVYVYKRPSMTKPHQLFQILEFPDIQEFGDNVLCTPDNRFIFIASTHAGSNTGQVDVYKRQSDSYSHHTGGKYIHHKTLLSTIPIQDDQFGSIMKLIEQNGVDYLYVFSKKSNGGTVHIYANGVIADHVYDWDPATDYRYAGVFDELASYSQNQIVEHQGELYISSYQVNAGIPFNLGNWNKVYDTVHLDPVLEVHDWWLTGHLQSASVNNRQEIIWSITNDIGDTHVAVLSIQNGHYVVTQEIQGNKSFAHSIEVNADHLLLGCPSPHDKNGQILVYMKHGTEYQLIQTIQDQQDSGHFGSFINTTGSTLIIGSERSNSKNPLAFEHGLFFDNQFTTFYDHAPYTGRAHWYQRIGDEYLKTQTTLFENRHDIDLTLFSSSKDNVYYATIQNHNDLSVQSVNVQYQPWSIISEYKPTVDVSKIKNIGFYDTVTGKLLKQIEPIDIFQDQLPSQIANSITHKTPYDPAIYTIGDNVNVDPGTCWLDDYIGKIWWDTSEVKYQYPYQGNALYSSATWCKLIDSQSIHVYEWTESTLSPEEWDLISQTHRGISAGVTGSSRYGNSAYSTRKRYDPVSKNFTTYYYFWVEHKTTSVGGMSVNSIKNTLTDPFANGHAFIGMISPTQLSLYNCQNITNNDVLLKIEYWGDKVYKNSKIHNEYQLVSESPQFTINESILNKWIDSLVGIDINGHEVPDHTLSPSSRYGISNSIRQSIFVNRVQALTQVMNAVNNSLTLYNIAQLRDLSRLFERDPAPDPFSNRYDQSVETLLDLDYVNTNKLMRATLSLNVENGKIISVNIDVPGHGYKTPPTVEISGSGSGAILQSVINEDGAIEQVLVISQGTNYSKTDSVRVRGYSVLVLTNENFNGKWVLYERSANNTNWTMRSIQRYDVQLYWEYVDWYKSGYDSNTRTDHVVVNQHDLMSLPKTAGDVIKIKHDSDLGWALVLITDPVHGYYEYIAKQNGTILFLKKLHDPWSFKVRYDSTKFDSEPYDVWPYKEIRLILEAIKNVILTDELASEFYRIFFSTIRYALSEQPHADWAFKTSFVSITHRGGELSQPVTYTKNKFPSYEQYIKEIKPYKTKIREYIENYTTIDHSVTSTCDFEFSSANENDAGKTIRYDADDNLITSIPLDTVTKKHWLDNHGVSIKSITILNHQVVYNQAPQLQVVGKCNRTSMIQSVLDSNGRIDSISVLDSGSGYVSAPIVVNETTQEEIPVSFTFDHGAVRSTNCKMKFDRIGSQNIILDSVAHETFTAISDQPLFVLSWPVSTRKNTITVLLNGTELIGEYTVSNILDYSKTYTRQIGTLVINKLIHVGDVIEITYTKDAGILSAFPRTQLYYEQNPLQYASNPVQLMTGVDYGGATVTGGSFNKNKVWGVTPWMSTNWTSNMPIVNTYTYSGQTEFELSNFIDSGQLLNVYVNDVRIDDEYYGNPGQLNSAAHMESITLYSTNYNAGSKTVTMFDAGYTPLVGDIVKIIDSENDASDINDVTNYDQYISGGDLLYRTATGVKPESIITDGGSFKYPNQNGPEELVTGNIIDTLDIMVHQRAPGCDTPDCETTKWRQFKDIYNRDHYKRIETVTQTTQDISPTTSSIIVENGNTLPKPGINSGVVFINGERIEYYNKDGDRIYTLIRGTLGTSIPSLTPAGTQVQVQDSNYNLDYDDQYAIDQFSFNGSYNFELSFSITNINQVEVFVGGRRLRKLDSAFFNPSNGMDSPEGDSIIEQEFYIQSVPGYDTKTYDESNFDPTTHGSVNSSVSINSQIVHPIVGETVTVVLKTGQVWDHDELFG